MSIKNKDLQESSSDVVKSQLSSAYQDGVTGYGDKPDSTEILEQSYVFHVNDVSNYSSVDHTDGSVNKKAINKVASIQIDNGEIDRVKDKLEAAFLEENIEAQIVLMVLALVNNSGDQQLKNKFQQIKQKCLQEVESANQGLVLAGRLFHAIQMYEMTLAKGNLLKNAPGWIKSTEPFSTVFYIPSRAYHGYDPFVLYNTDMGTNINGAQLPITDIMKKLMHCLDTEDVDSIDSKTVTTLITQMFALAEAAMDFGVSERFFKRALSVDNTVEEGGSGYDSVLDKSDFVSPTSALCFKPAVWKVYDSFSSEGAPPTLKSIFSKNADGEVGPQSRPDLRAHAAVEILGNEMGSNPDSSPINRIPTFYETLNSKEQLIYLSTIVGRELTMSRGIACMSQTLYAQEFESATGLAISDIYTADRANSLPLCRHGSRPGQRILGPSNSLAVSQTPTYSPGAFMDPAQSPLHNLVLRKHPEMPETGPPQGFMPLEVLPSGDPELYSLIGQASTLKSLVTEKIYENPKNPAGPLQVHLDYLEDVKKYVAAGGNTIAKLNTVQPQDGPQGAFDLSNLSGRIIRKALRDIGTMLVDADKISDNSDSNELKNRGRMALSNLVALTKFFKPNSIATTHQKFIKSDFLRRVAIVDLMYNAIPTAQPDGSYLIHHIDFQHSKKQMGIPGSNGPLGYNAGLRNSFLRLSPGAILAEGNLGIYSYDPNYFSQIDGTCGYHYETGLKREYFTGENEPADGYFEEGGENQGMAAGTGVNINTTHGPSEAKQFTTQLYKCTSDKNPMVNAALSSASSAATNENIVDAAFQVSYQFQNNLGKKAAVFEDYGFYFINHVWGPTKGDQTWDTLTDNRSLIGRILQTAASLQQSAALDAPDEEHLFATAGVTVANGMDKADLLAYILEIYSILADELLKAVFCPSPFSTAYNHIFGHQDGLSFTAVSHHDFGNISTGFQNAGFKHYFAVAPKISAVNIHEGGAAQNAQGGLADKHIHIKDFGNFLISLGDESKISLNLYREDNFAYWVSQTIQNAFGSGAAAEEIADILHKPGTFDYKVGPTLTMSKFQEIFRETAEEASFPCLASSGALELLGYIRAIYTMDPFDHDNTQGSTNMIASLKQDLANDLINDEVFEKFIKNGSQAQVYAGAQRTIEIASSITNKYSEWPFLDDDDSETYSGVNFRTRAKAMLKASSFYLDYIKNESDDFIEFTFFGITHKSHKDEMIKRIALDANLNSNDAKGIKYDFSFIKSSEFYPEIEQIKNNAHFKDIEFDLNFYAPYTEICNAINGTEEVEPATDFLDLVQKVKFLSLTHADYNFTKTGMETFTGAQLIKKGTDSGLDIDEARGKLINSLGSQMSVFIFERLTGFPISHINLPEVRTKSISKKSLKVFLDGIKKSPIGFTYNSDKVIESLFDNDKRYDLSGIGDEALVFTTSESKLNKALSPTLVRENGEAKFIDPLVNEDLYVIIQSILKTNYLTQHSIGEQILAPGLFEAVLGVNTSILHRNNSFKTIPSPTDVDDLVLKDNLSEIRKGEMKIDNYRAVVKRRVTKE